MIDVGALLAAAATAAESGAAHHVRCADCGEVMGDRRERRYWPATCQPCAARADLERRAASLARAAESVPAYFRWALGPGARARATVHVSPAIEVGRAELAVTTGGATVVLVTGGTGAGKTSLGCYLLGVLLGLAPRAGSSRYMMARQIARADRESRLGAEPPILAAARSAAVLVIDELGGEPSGWDAIRDVIIDRHAAELPTILGSWRGPAGVAERYGDGVARRVGYVSRLAGSGA